MQTLKTIRMLQFAMLIFHFALTHLHRGKAFDEID